MNKEDLIKYVIENLGKTLPENIEYHSPSVSGYSIGIISEGGRIEDKLKIEFEINLINFSDRD